MNRTGSGKKYSIKADPLPVPKFSSRNQIEQRQVAGGDNPKAGQRISPSQAQLNTGRQGLVFGLECVFVRGSEIISPTVFCSEKNGIGHECKLNGSPTITYSPRGHYQWHSRFTICHIPLNRLRIEPVRHLALQAQSVPQHLVNQAGHLKPRGSPQCQRDGSGGATAAVSPEHTERKQANSGVAAALRKGQQHLITSTFVVKQDPVNAIRKAVDHSGNVFQGNKLRNGRTLSHLQCRERYCCKP
jgi:hypothetical protein